MKRYIYALLLTLTLTGILLAQEAPVSATYKPTKKPLVIVRVQNAPTFDTITDETTRKQLAQIAVNDMAQAGMASFFLDMVKKKDKKWDQLLTKHGIEVYDEQGAKLFPRK